MCQCVGVRLDIRQCVESVSGTLKCSIPSLLQTLYGPDSGLQHIPVYEADVPNHALHGPVVILCVCKRLQS